MKIFALIHLLVIIEYKKKIRNWRFKNLLILIQIVTKYFNFNCDRKILIVFNTKEKVLICRWILMNRSNYLP